MPPKSSVEKSKYYNEILDMIKEGLSSRSISEHLKNEYNENISHTAINNYVRKIKDKTNSEYYKKKKEKKEKVKAVVDTGVDNKEILDEVIKKGVSDLDALDNIIKEADGLELNIGNLRAQRYSDYVVTTEADIEKIKIQAKGLAIRAVIAKAKILKDDPTPPGVILPAVVIDKNEEDQLNKEIVDELR